MKRFSLALAVFLIASLVGSLSPLSQTTSADSPAIWSGISSDLGIYGATYGDGFVYAGTYRNPCSVFKIDPTTMLTSAVWAGASGEMQITCMEYIGGFVYAGLDVIPGKVIKINPTTMLTVAEWIGVAGEERVNGLAFDGTCLYVSLWSTPSKVAKVDIATMTTVGSVWTGTTGQNFGGHLEWDGTYIYDPLFINPAKVIKIDPATMTTSGIWAGASNEYNAYGLCYDGTYIYAGMGNFDFLAKVIKIDTSTMATVSEWTGAAGEVCVNWLTYAGSYVYVPLQVSPGKIIKVDPTTMTTAAEWAGDATQPYIDVLPSDGTYLYGGVASAVYTKMIKIDSATMSTAMVKDSVSASKLVGADDVVGVNNISGTVIYCRFQAVETGTVTQFKVKSGATAQVIVAAYSDTSNAPDALLSANNTPQNVASGWNTLTISPFTVTKNVYYWLAVDMSNVTGAVQYASTSGHYKYKVVTWGGYTFPDPADTGMADGTNAYFLFACYGVSIDAPSASTSAATNIGVTTATLNGSIDNLNSGTNCTIRGFQYGITTSYGNDWHENGSFDISNFNSSITGLLASSAYHFRTYATNSLGTGYGADQILSTLPSTPISTTFLIKVFVNSIEKASWTQTINSNETVNMTWTITNTGQ